MRIDFLACAISLVVAVQPAGAALVTTEDFHAAQPHGASPLLLPRLPEGESSSTVLLEAALFTVVRHELAAQPPTGSVALVPKSRRPREQALLQFGSAALSQGAVYAHSMVGLFDLLGTDVWRQFALPEWSADEAADKQAPASLDAFAHSDVAVSLYSILGATAFAASPFYLALGTLAAETLLAVPAGPMLPLALFLTAGIAGAVLIGRRRGR